MYKSIFHYPTLLKCSTVSVRKGGLHHMAILFMNKKSGVKGEFSHQIHFNQSFPDVPPFWLVSPHTQCGHINMKDDKM